jgi:hypothetical protein
MTLETPNGTPESLSPECHLTPIATHRLTFHAFADFLPLLDQEALHELANDIREHGLLNAIVLYEAQILDGRCRYLACELAAISPRFETYDGDDPLQYVLSRNIQRRHLLKEGQRAIAAARIGNLECGSNQHSNGMSVAAASKCLNVSARSVARAKKVLRHGVSELVQAVHDGRLSVHAAARISRLSELDQREHLRGGHAVTRLLQAAPAPPPAGSAPYAAMKCHEHSGGTPGGLSDSRAPEKNGFELSSVGTSEDAELSSKWDDSELIAKSEVTVIMGTAGSAIMSVVTKLAAAVSSGGGGPGRYPVTCGKVIWLASRHRIRQAHLSDLLAGGADWDQFHFLEPKLDDFGVPIHHLRADVARLETALSTSANVGLVVIDYFSPYLAHDDGRLGSICSCIAALKQLASKSSAPIVFPLAFPCRDGSTVIKTATNALSAVPELDKVLFVSRKKSWHNDSHERLGPPRQFDLPFSAKRKSRRGQPGDDCLATSEHAQIGAHARPPDDRLPFEFEPRHVECE